MPEKSTAFKNWINEKVVKDYATSLKRVNSKFNHESFLQVGKSLHDLELRQRVRAIAEQLKSHLPTDFKVALSDLMMAIKNHDLTGFALWPATEFIQIYGIDNKEDSLSALKELTVRFTSEFAVRPFIIKYPEWTMVELEKLARHKNVHVRRWASEGSRPRLPWGERLHNLVKDPRPGLKILEALKFDPELYVRKSVANHLNDIAKDHPELVIETLKRWQKAMPQEFTKEFNFIVNRSLRTMIKNGHSEALKLVGIKAGNEHIKVDRFNLMQKSVRVGQALEFSFRIKNASSKPQTYLIDYVVWHQKANGTLTPKVFKLKSGKIAAKQSIDVNKKHSFKVVTTRRYHKGPHQLGLLINGKPAAKLGFRLV